VEQSSLPWSTFFDLDSLNRHVSVMEFHDFLEGLLKNNTILYCHHLSHAEGVVVVGTIVSALH